MAPINLQTGLEESWNDRYKIPVVHQQSLDSLRFDGHKVAIHQAPARAVPTFDFYAKLAPAEELYVSLHGAVIAKTGRYPKFWRVMSMRNRVPAFLAIADPTLQLSDRSDFCLGWYTGGENWDPIEEVATIVRQAMEHVGATRVMFLGGSGGGFAALRMATHFPGSMAFVQEPQTSVSGYFPYHQKLLAETCWSAKDPEQVLEQDLERFDLTHLYREIDPDCYVYYRQSTGDPFHVRNHLIPFQLAIAETKGAKEGRYKFILEGGEVPGHGNITPAEFDDHFERAVGLWRLCSERSVEAADAGI